MTHLKLDDFTCRNAQAKLDSYIDDELLVETNLELTQHFDRCPECAVEVATRRELRSRIRAAVRLTAVPPGLDALVRERLRQSPRNRPPWSLMAIAAVLVAGFGSWLAVERVGLPVPSGLAALLRIGAGDHLHCAVIRQGV